MQILLHGVILKLILLIGKYHIYNVKFKKKKKLSTYKEKVMFFYDLEKENASQQGKRIELQ